MRKKISVLLTIVLMSLVLISCSRKEDTYVTSTEGVFSYDNASVYFALTDRFKDGDKDNNMSYGRVNVDSLGKDIGTFHGGDIKGMTEKLEEGYFIDLGINAIWITAPYEQIHGYVGGGKEGDFAHYGYHGYYALDWTMMDQNMGTVEEFRTFADKAHEQGIRIIMDVIMNHVGYPNLMDMQTYGYGGVENLPENFTVDQGEDFTSYQDYVDYESPRAWEGFFGDWVRAELPGYTKPGEGEVDFSLAGLPDVRTEVEEDLGLAPILETKWALEKDQDWAKSYIPPIMEGLRQDLNLAPAEYITTWLSAWVEEFGLDGFRIDTAKHVEIERWHTLKEEADQALKAFRKNNPENVAANFTDDFFMVGEVWGHGVLKDYYFDYGFDALINFTFQGLKKDGPAFKPDNKVKIFENYAKALNEDEDFNVLSYISQHDTTLYPRDKLYEGAGYLLMLPGAIQIFYGDEVAREMGDGGTDATQGTRSSIDWANIDTDLLEHVQKLGSFRNRNLAVGAGQHKTLSKEPLIYMRSYEKEELENEVVIYEGDSGKQIIDVSEAFIEGATLRDGYTDKIYTVKEGKVTVDVHEKGYALLEEVFKVEKESESK